MLEQFVGQVIVVDLKSPYVCLGKLVGLDDHYLELGSADLHDFRDSDTTRENYLAASRATGIKRNRKRLLLVRSEVVAISLFDDIAHD